MNSTLLRISILLAALSLFAACGGDSTPQEEQASSGGETATAESDEAYGAADEAQDADPELGANLEE